MEAAVEEVVVLYEYSAQLPDELSLRVGDVITRVERMEGGWWRGDLAGNTGMFPDNFVKVRESTDRKCCRTVARGERGESSQVFADGVTTATGRPGEVPCRVVS